MKLSLRAQIYRLPLNHRFTISRYSVTEQTTMIVTISDGSLKGFGEATVNPYYHSTEQKLLESVEKVRAHVENATNLHPTELWTPLAQLLPDDFFALSAIDCALWDFYAKSKNQTLRSLFTDSEKAPLTSLTIGIASKAEMKAKIQSAPWPIYKIKLGTEDDLSLLKALRSVTKSPFRVDAN